MELRAVSFPHFSLVSCGVACAPQFYKRQQIHLINGQEVGAALHLMIALINTFYGNGLCSLRHRKYSNNFGRGSKAMNFKSNCFNP